MSSVGQAVQRAVDLHQSRTGGQAVAPSAIAQRWKPSTSAERAHLYEDVRKLLYPGFLTHIVRINGTVLTFRTLLPADTFHLSEAGEPESEVLGDETVWRQRGSRLLLCALWSLDGEPLWDTPKPARRRLRRALGDLPRSILLGLLVATNSLLAREQRAVEGLEPFLYEEESRFLWKGLGMKYLEGQGVLPRPMGYNPVQRLWARYNQSEDERERTRREWSFTKFITSPHAPKEIGRINKSEQSDEQEVLDARQACLDAFYYKSKGVSLHIPKKRIGNAELKSASTVEELEDEMKRWILGEKDEHDLIIDAYKEKIRQLIESRKQVQEDARRAYEEALRENGIPSRGVVSTSVTASQADASLVEELNSRFAPRKGYDVRGEPSWAWKLERGVESSPSLAVDPKTGKIRPTR